jgi:hypothetical protein
MVTNVTMIANVLHQVALAAQEKNLGNPFIYHLAHGGLVRADVLSEELADIFEIDPFEADFLLTKMVRQRYLETWEIRGIIKYSVTEETMQNLLEQFGD